MGSVQQQAKTPQEARDLHVGEDLCDRPQHDARAKLGQKKQMVPDVQDISPWQEHFHPEFKKYDEERQRYLPKGFREPWQRKRGMGRRYYRYLPKLKIPLEEDSGPFPN